MVYYEFCGVRTNNTDSQHATFPSRLLAIMTTPSNDAPATDAAVPAGAAPAMYRYINCEKCGKRMLVEIREGIQAHRCPVCQAVLQTTFRDGQLTVETMA